MFNRAIMKAPTYEEKKGRDLSLAIANRSAALMRLGYLKLALEDVEFALQSGYPADLRWREFYFVEYFKSGLIEGTNYWREKSKSLQR